MFCNQDFCTFDLKYAGVVCRLLPVVLQLFQYFTKGIENVYAKTKRLTVSSLLVLLNVSPANVSNVNPN